MSSDSFGLQNSMMAQQLLPASVLENIAVWSSKRINFHPQSLFAPDMDWMSFHTTITMVNLSYIYTSDLDFDIKTYINKNPANITMTINKTDFKYNQPVYHIISLFIF